MFFDEPLDSFVSQIIVEKLSSILKQGMDSGAFVSSNAAISRVDFVELRQEEEAYIAVKDEEFVQNPGSDSKVPVFAWIVVTCIIIVALITIQRFRKRNLYEDMHNEPEISHHMRNIAIPPEENDFPLQMEEETIVTANTNKGWDMLPIPSSDTTTPPNEDGCDCSTIYDACGTPFSSITGKHYW